MAASLPKFGGNVYKLGGVRGGNPLENSPKSGSFLGAP
jgi:hypothetical protein